MGTAYAIVTGIEEEGYSGTKRVAFKISGMPIKKATVEGLADKTFIYEGTDVEPELQLTVKRKNNGTETVDILEQDRDYTITWQKNQNAGTAAVIFTGKGRYTGTLKKSFQIGRFDIAANEGGRIEAALEDRSVVFTRGGARPKPTVTFLTGDGRIRTLAEGKFVADDALLHKLARHGQIATQYVNEDGLPTMDGADNLNGSSWAIEGILSEDGHIFGKMGHSERYEDGLFQNISGNKNQNIFENGVRFFTHKKK